MNSALLAHRAARMVLPPDNKCNHVCPILQRCAQIRTQLARHGLFNLDVLRGSSRADARDYQRQFPLLPVRRHDLPQVNLGDPVGKIENVESVTIRQDDHVESLGWHPRDLGRKPSR